MKAEKQKKISIKSNLIPRNFLIRSEDVGERFFVYKGNEIINFRTNKLMVGHLVGEFAHTRKVFSFKKKQLSKKKRTVKNKNKKRKWDKNQIQPEYGYF